MGTIYSMGPSVLAEETAPLPDVSAWEVSVEVQLPRYIWFVADFNEQARVSLFRLDLRLDCEDRRQGREWIRDCQVSDASIAASPLPGDEQALGRILPELDAKLTGSRVSVGFRSDGRIRYVHMSDVREINRVHPRIRAMEENLRLMVSRAVAGWDLTLPTARAARGAVTPEAWAQPDTWMILAPSSVGTMGGVEMVHTRAPGSTRVDTAAKALIAPSGSSDDAADIYETRLVAEARMDRAGGLQERRWLVVGIPTPSSAISDGPAGLPYVQVGELRRLEADEVLRLPESQVLATGTGASVLRNRLGGFGERP